MGKTADYELAYMAVREKTDFVPRIGIVLGSGLGGLADDIEVVARIPYSELDGFPRSTVEGHKGEYIFGYIGSVPVVLMNGRVHFYEGYPMQKVVLPVRVMALMGVEAIILTNAAGGLNAGFHPGTLMCITDQNTARKRRKTPPGRRSSGRRRKAASGRSLILRRRWKRPKN